MVAYKQSRMAKFKGVKSSTAQNIQTGNDPEPGPSNPIMDFFATKRKFCLGDFLIKQYDPSTANLEDCEEYEFYDEFQPKNPFKIRSILAFDQEVGEFDEYLSMEAELDRYELLFRKELQLAIQSQESRPPPQQPPSSSPSPDMSATDDGNLIFDYETLPGYEKFPKLGHEFLHQEYRYLWDPFFAAPLKRTVARLPEIEMFPQFQTTIIRSNLRPIFRATFGISAKVPLDMHGRATDIGPCEWVTKPTFRPKKHVLRFQKFLYKLCRRQEFVGQNFGQINVRLPRLGASELLCNTISEILSRQAFLRLKGRKCIRRAAATAVFRQTQLQTIVRKIPCRRTENLLLPPEIQIVTFENEYFPSYGPAEVFGSTELYTEEEQGFTELNYQYDECLGIQPQLYLDTDVDPDWWEEPECTGTAVLDTKYYESISEGSLKSLSPEPELNTIEDLVEMFSKNTPIGGTTEQRDPAAGGDSFITENSFQSAEYREEEPNRRDSIADISGDINENETKSPPRVPSTKASPNNRIMEAQQMLRGASDYSSKSHETLQTTMYKTVRKDLTYADQVRYGVPKKPETVITTKVVPDSGNKVNQARLKPLNYGSIRNRIMTPQFPRTKPLPADTAQGVPLMVFSNIQQQPLMVSPVPARHSNHIQRQSIQIPDRPDVPIQSTSNMQKQQQSVKVPAVPIQPSSNIQQQSAGPEPQTKMALAPEVPKPPMIKSLLASALAEITDRKYLTWRDMMMAPPAAPVTLVEEAPLVLPALVVLEGPKFHAEEFPKLTNDYDSGSSQHVENVSKLSYAKVVESKNEHAEQDQIKEQKIQLKLKSSEIPSLFCGQIQPRRRGPNRWKTKPMGN